MNINDSKVMKQKIDLIFCFLALLSFTNKYILVDD